MNSYLRDDLPVKKEKSVEMQALETIVKNKGLNGIKEPIEIIETALKDYENLKKEYDLLLSVHNSIVKQYNHLCSKILKGEKLP